LSAFCVLLVLTELCWVSYIRVGLGVFYGRCHQRQFRDAMRYRLHHNIRRSACMCSSKGAPMPCHNGTMASPSIGAYLRSSIARATSYIHC